MKLGRPLAFAFAATLACSIWLAWYGPVCRAAEVPRLVLTFYYPWYGNPNYEDGSGRWAHWQGVDEKNHQIASSTHYPQLGAYDSHSPKIIEQHCRWAKQAGIDALICSWWGHGSFSDQAMPRILDACAKFGLKATVYYETVPPPRNAKAAAEDILRLLHKYGTHEAWLRVEGRPVVFVYGRAVGQLGVDGWEEAISILSKRMQPAPFLVGDRFSPQAAKVFDGLHTYNTAGSLRDKPLDQVKQWTAETFPKWVKLARDSGRLVALTVIPGYDDTKIRKPGLRVPRYDGQSYAAQWQAAIDAKPDWVLITSWNEWHEGSEIEPSLEDGDKYLKLTAQWTKVFKAGR